MTFQLSLIHRLLFLGASIGPLLSGCDRIRKQNTDMGKTDLTPDTTKSETFQELGFFGKIKEDHWDRFLLSVKNNIANSRKEPGNLSFRLYQPENGDLQPIWFERFKDKKAHNYHKAQKYFKDAITVIQKSLEGEPSSIELKELPEIPATIPILADKPEITRHVILLLDVRPEKRQAFIDAMAVVVPQSRQSRGNLECNIYQYIDDPNRFVLMAGWISIANHEARLVPDYIQRLNTVTEDFFVSRPMDTYWLTKDISQ
jgi:quinol monooxygenase YgiN